MATIVRVLNRACLLRAAIPQLTRRSTITTKTAYDEMREFWAKNKQLARPMSPCLSTYGYHLTMVMSITNRVQAVAQQGVLVVGSCIMLVAPFDFKAVVKKIRSLNLNPAIIYAGKTVIAVPFVYHFLCSLRHMAWDAGKGYGRPVVLQTGYTILAATALISSFLVFGVKPSAM